MGLSAAGNGRDAESGDDSAPRRFRFSLKAAWYVLILLLAVLPVLFTAVYFSRQYQRTSLDYAAWEISLINKEVKDHLEYAITDVQGILGMERRLFQRYREQHFSGHDFVDPAIIAGLQQQLYQSFDIMGKHEALITGIYLVDGETNMLTLWRRAAAAADLSGSEFVYVVLPLSSTDLSQGMVWAEIDLRVLWQEEADLVGREGYYSYLLDEQGRVLDGGDELAWLQGLALQPTPMAGLQTFTDEAGRRFYGDLMSIAGTDWRVLTMVPRHDVLAPIYRTFGEVIVVMAVILLVFVTLGLRMVRGMLGYIDNLLAAFSRAAREDFSPLGMRSVFRECCQIRNGYNRLVADLAARDRRRCAAEAALGESERQYRSLVDNIPGAIFRSGCIDGQWEILYISDAIEAISGYPARDFMNNAVRSYSSMIVAEDLAPLREKIDSAIEARRAYEAEYRIHGRDGTLRWVYEKGQPVYGPDGAFLWLDGVVFDISAQKEAERQHQRLLCEYEAIARAITDVMFTVDVGGELMWCNDNLLEISGLSREQLKGQAVESLFIADRRHDIAMMIAACFETGMAEIEAEFLTREGPAPYHVKMVVLRNDLGDIVGIAASGRDMSHHRRLEKQLQQSQKMQSIGQLTGGIAHDFNNFLTAIIGFTDLARQRLGEAGDEKMAMYLDEVHKAGGRARALVAQMLAFSRGSDEAEAVALELVPVLKETLKMLSASLPSSMELVLEAQDTGGQVMADPVQLQQVIMNLCINARDAMQGQGRLEIALAERRELRTVCSSCHDTVMGDFLELSVSDSGCGIREADLERIFEPFFSTKAVGKGTGMGLAMVHGILHQHGGHIQVESGEGAGTTFRLLFPLLAREAGAGSPAAADMAPPAGAPSMEGRVLVVDDEPAVGHFLAELLQSRGCDSKVMSDSEEALALFQEDPAAFDLVITDQTMPGMSGAELAEEMLAIRPELPIILCTGYSEHIDEMRARMLGIRRYLTKPIDVMAFLDAVNELLDYETSGRRLAG